MPEQALHRQVPDIVRIDAAPPEGIDDGEPVVLGIVRDQAFVCRDQSPQIVAKIRIHRRTVVQSPNADIQDVSGRLGSLLGQSLHQVGADFAGVKDAGSRGCQPQKILYPRLVDG